MNKPNNYFECIFIDGTSVNFDKLCTSITEFTEDMLSFKSKNYDTNNEVLLQIIPKSQIKQIINHYLEDDMKRVWRVE